MPSGTMDTGEQAQRMSWRQYKALLQQKEAERKAEEAENQRKVRTKINNQRVMDEQRRKAALAAFKVTEEKSHNQPNNSVLVKKAVEHNKSGQNAQDTVVKRNALKPVSSKQNSKKNYPLKPEYPEKTAQVINKVLKPSPKNNHERKVAIRNKTNFSPATEQLLARKRNKELTDRKETNRHKKENDHVLSPKQITQHDDKSRISPNVYGENDPILRRHVAKAKKFDHVSPRLYDYSQSERISKSKRPYNHTRDYPVNRGGGSIWDKRNRQDTTNSLTGERRAKTQEIHGHEYYYDIPQRSISDRSPEPIKPNRTYQKGEGMYKVSGEIYMKEEDFHEYKDTEFEAKRKTPKSKRPSLPIREADRREYMYNEHWNTPETVRPDIKTVIKSTSRVEDYRPDPNPETYQQARANQPATVGKRERLPEIRGAYYGPKPVKPSVKTPDLSRYSLPSVNSDTDMDSSFRYKRILGETEEKKSRFTDRETWNVIVSSLPRQRKKEAASIDTNSLSTLHLDSSQNSVRTNMISRPSKRQAKDFDLQSIKSGQRSLHDDRREGVRRAVQSPEPATTYDRFEQESAIDESSSQALSLPESSARGPGAESNVQEEFVPPRAFQEHRSWPIYKFQKEDVIACLVRASPSLLEDVKRGLQLVDNVARDVISKLPPLPQAEFDADETVVLSPMQLVWKNTNRQVHTLGEPIYLYMPVNTGVYNDVLQHMSFLYTVDLLQWRFAECRMVRMPVDNQEFDFLEVLINDPFRMMVFDLKARYIEDAREVEEVGTEFHSTMEPNIRVQVARRSFDTSATVKIRIEPLDMNETDLRTLIPTQNAMRTAAVSPIIKVTSSEPTKRPISLFVPKPGKNSFGSVKLGLRCKLSDLRSSKVTLYVKDKKISKYQPDTCLRREFANEFEFTVRIWKHWTSCYCLLVLEGQEPGPSDGHLQRNAVMEELGLPDIEGGFLTGDFLKRLSWDMEKDELKVMSLGRQLLNASTTNDIVNSSNTIDLVSFKLLKRWRNLNPKKSEGTLVRKLVVTLKESGLHREASFVQDRYSAYVIKGEGNRLMSLFEELKQCSSVLVNWRSLGLALGLTEQDVYEIQTDHRDVRKRCGAMLKLVFSRLRQEFDFHRDILLCFIKGLETIGCHRVAASVTRRHLPKFFVNIT